MRKKEISTVTFSDKFSSLYPSKFSKISSSRNWSGNSELPSDSGMSSNVFCSFINFIWRHRLSDLLIFCTVLSFPCYIWHDVTQDTTVFWDLFTENIVTVSTLFASAMTEYLTIQVFDGSFKILVSTYFSAFLNFCSFKRPFEIEVSFSSRQTEMELYKLNLVQALYDNKTTLLDCNLDSIVLIHNSAYHKFDTNSLFTDQRVHK